MKKHIAILLAVCLLFLLAAGCAEASIEPVDINAADDLSGKKIGVQQGTTGDIYCSDFADEKDDAGKLINPDTKIRRYKNGAEAVTALIKGKVDAVVIDNEPAKIFVEKNSDEIKILDEEFENEDYAVCIAKENTELLAQFNECIQQFKQDGTLQGLLDYYINKTEGAKKYQSPENVDRSKGKLIMATNAAFEPYEYMEGGKVVGLDVDLAQAVCDKLGYELQIDNMEFDSIIVAVTSGRADFGAAGMTVTEDRLKNINFTDTYCNAIQAIIVRK